MVEYASLRGEITFSMYDSSTQDPLQENWLNCLHVDSLFIT